MSKHNSFQDQADSFGWISIGLHWTTTVAIVVLWFLGQSISSQPAEELDARRALHVTIGLIVWLPLGARILWRFRSKHPHVTGQSLLTHRAARITHYTLLIVLTVMIVSGPLMAWVIPEKTGLAEIALQFHSNAAKLLFVLVVLHILAAFKHLMFHDDETIARIFVPHKKG